MPIYEYQCKRCGNRFEHLARRLSDKPTACTSCGASALEKQFSTFSAPEGGKTPTACSLGSCAAPTCASGQCPFG